MKKKDKLQMLKKDEIQILKCVEKSEEQGGKENLICIIGVSSLGEKTVIEKLNIEEACDYYVEEVNEYINYDFYEDPGIYLVEFHIDGSGPDYNGEYDSWSVFDSVIKYNIKIKDKRNTKPINVYYEKIYGEDNPGTEYPRCLLAITDSGDGRILDILNEDKAYKCITREIPYYLENIIEDIKFESNYVYISTISIVGDMEYIFDDDKDELKFSNIKKIKLEKGEK